MELEAQTGVAEAVAQAAERKAARMAQQVEQLQVAADSRVAADNFMADDGLHGAVRTNSIERDLRQSVCTDGVVDRFGPPSMSVCVLLCEAR